MNRQIRSAAAIMALAACVVGCRGGDSPTEAYDPETWQGAIDTSLPDEMQRKQNAIIRLFTAIQEVGVEAVSEEDPNLRFEEKPREFFENGTVDLYRWDWDGPPKGDNFPVVLILRRDEPGFPEVEVHRTYTVRRSGKRYTIRRSR